MAEIYGYVRVSTKEQNEERQMVALRAVHVPKQHIFWINSRERILTGRTISAY